MVRVWNTPHGIPPRHISVLSHFIWLGFELTQNLSNLKIDHVLRSEEDSGESDDESKAGHDSVAISEAFRHETVDEQTNDFSHICALFPSAQHPG